jgi:PilZ domain-containing protein
MTERCPQCKGRHLRYSREVGFLSTLLSKVHMCALRCQLCGHRFWVFRRDRDIGTHDDMSDLREYQRVVTKCPVSFFGDQVMGDGDIADLSIRGCLVRSTKPVSPESVLSLTVFHSAYDKPIDITKAVVRHCTSNGFGVEFVWVNPKEENRLRLRLSLLMSGATTA